MTIADDIARLRSVLGCRHGQVVHECWAPDGDDRTMSIEGEIERVLDELAQLQEATRWRDPAVELPEDNRPVIVALRRIEGLWPPIPAPPVIAECEGSSWWVDDEEIRDVRAWRPLPDPPPT